ncbi:unnamed protein product [Didymodactylos carnosus]|uniref:Ankyrin repeat protein n=1 Tax=Didymodactylos carnosus TaxID=1234261 RepID=A0A8S2GTF6_9BILA|nr:unnamed protein product [Didymodactylos carnosus]CAF3556448.1 unnamed protein product [Didymodactylos carnosus]
MGDSNDSWIWCAKTGDFQTFQAMLKHSPEKVNEQMNGRYLIHYAADSGNFDILQELIKNGANINIKDKFGITPLLAAIYESHASCVSYVYMKQ